MTSVISPYLTRPIRSCGEVLREKRVFHVYSELSDWDSSVDAWRWSGSREIGHGMGLGDAVEETCQSVFQASRLVSAKLLPHVRAIHAEHEDAESLRSETRILYLPTHITEASARRVLRLIQNGG